MVLDMESKTPSIFFVMWNRFKNDLLSLFCHFLRYFKLSLSKKLCLWSSMGHRFLWSWIWNLRHLQFFCYVKPFQKRFVASFLPFSAVFQALFIKKNLCLRSSMGHRILWSWIWNRSSHKKVFNLFKKKSNSVTLCLICDPKNVISDLVVFFCMVFDMVSKIHRNHTWLWYGI